VTDGKKHDQMTILANRPSQLIGTLVNLVDFPAKIGDIQISEALFQVNNYSQKIILL
jgi:hypothetical protein